jgi:hypothetical protein
MYNNVTYEKAIEEACQGLVGTCMDSIEQHLEFWLERDPTDEDIVKAEEYMAQAGITECDCCGWWQDCNDGMNGNLCYQCAEDEANEANEDD